MPPVYVNIITFEKEEREKDTRVHVTVKHMLHYHVRKCHALQRVTRGDSDSGSAALFLLFFFSTTIGETKAVHQLST